MNKTLINLKNHLDQEAGVDLSTRSRHRPIVLFRVLYYKLALDLTSESTIKIAKVVDRDHSTIIHSRNNTFEYMMSLEKYRNLYKKYMALYNTEVIDFTDEESIEIQRLTNQLNKQLDNVAELERIVNSMSGGLTKNEKEYRKLTIEQQMEYDKRIGLFLKSLTWNKQNQTVQIIDCSNVVDARGIL